MSPPNEDYFSTTDLGLAAALLCHGFKVGSLDRDSGRRFLFVFEKGLGMDKSIEAYWKGLMSIEPQFYFDAIKQLKARIHNYQT